MRLTPNTSDALASAESRTEPTMSLWEKRNVFREMVSTTCRNGSVSAWRRRQLVQYAAKLGLHPVQAGKLVEDAQATAATLRSTAPAASLSYVDVCPPVALSNWDIGSGVVLVAVLLNVWVLMAILL